MDVGHTVCLTRRGKPVVLVVPDCGESGKRKLGWAKEQIPLLPGWDGRAILTRIARELPVDAIVLAGTDLSLIFDESNADFAHIDCTAEHIDEIIRRLRNR